MTTRQIRYTAIAVLDVVLGALLGVLFASLVFAFGCAGAGAGPDDASRAAAKPPAHHGVRLYALDCGRIEINDAGTFTDSGKPVGRPLRLVDPCFLIVHPRGKLLWDTGLPAAMQKSPDGVANPIGRMFVEKSLVDQLTALSLAPADIQFVGFSHLHFDHAGNANLFTGSTWLLNRRELEAGLATPPPVGVDASAFSSYRSARLKLLDRDEDVFGDGSVEVLQTPGHTPGHQSLLVRLDRGGAVLLTGDLAHSRENWQKHIVPSFNHSREDTLASFARVEQLVAREHARVVVQHAPEDFHALPVFPAYLD